MSGADEAGDRVGRLADPVGGAVTALSDAVAEVLFKQAEGDRLQCLGDRGDLGEDVDYLVDADSARGPAPLRDSCR